MSPKLEGLLAINIAAVIFGTAALYGKLPVSPFWIVCIRGFLAAVTLHLLPQKKQRIGFKDRKWLWLCGFILAIHWLSFFHSVQTAGVAIATLTFASFPMLTIFLESIVSDKKLTWRKLSCGALILLGVLALIQNEPIKALSIGTFSGLLSAFTFSIFGLISQHSKLPALQISKEQNLAVGVLTLPFIFFFGPPPVTLSHWGSLLALGTITTALMHQLYLFALRRLSASLCSVFVALEPVYAVVFAALLFHEPIGLNVIFSSFLILLGGCLLLIDEELSGGGSKRVKTLQKAS